MDWDNSLLVVVLLGAVFFAGAIAAFVWARRQRQFDDFEKGARSIFNDEEPEGTVTDAFPADSAPASSPDAKHPTR